MIKITKKIAKQLDKLELVGGFFEEFGAFIGDSEFILYYKKNGIYLAHVSEFEQSGIFIKLKE